MKIKSIPKEVRQEGLTLELINSVNLKVKPSPVMFEKGDEPCDLLPCSNGFWVRDPDEGGYLKDGKGNYLVFDERTCQIARARYLLNQQKQAESV